MSEKTLHVEIVTPYELFYEGPVEMVVVTGKDGEIGIMPGHTPLIVALVPGELRMKIDQQWRVAAASNGYAEISPDQTTIVVNAAEWPEQIDVQRAERALERAENRLKDPRLSNLEKTHARHSASRAKARLKVAKKFVNPQS